MSDLPLAIRRVNEFLEAALEHNKRVPLTNVNDGLMALIQLYDREKQGFVPYPLLKEDLVALVEHAEGLPLPSLSSSDA